MPIFEYICFDCRNRFEALIRGEAKAECPVCRSTDLEKQLSVFAAATGNGSARSELPVSACGSCGDRRGPGSCSMN
jgi:putative FmdB family regulatory protein